MHLVPPVTKCIVQACRYFRVISSTHNCCLQSSTGHTIKQVEDFKYLGLYVMGSQKDMKHRKALAWEACNRLNRLWRSNLPNDTKIYIFKTLVDPILLYYGAETWSLTARQQKRLDGAYTSMLRRVKGIHWSHGSMETSRTHPEWS